MELVKYAQLAQESAIVRNNYQGIVINRKAAENKNKIVATGKLHCYDSSFKDA